jgi:hypothetical protein
MMFESLSFSFFWWVKGGGRILHCDDKKNWKKYFSVNSKNLLKISENFTKL